MASPFPRPTHAFVVPAYGEPAWIDRCLDSLTRQSHRSDTLIATSTPSAYLSSAAQRHGVALVVNPIAAGIASDWNFALRQSHADWVTLAHQDDWYESDYADACLNAIGGAPRAVLAFTDAEETIAGTTTAPLNTRVKRTLAALASVGTHAIESRWRRRVLLGFGNPIPCPSAMINRRALPAFVFPDGWRSNLDWQAWWTIAESGGAIVHVGRPLVHRTLHPDAETTRALTDRAREDAVMFRQLWPAPIAAILNRLYAPSRAPYKTLRESERERTSR